MCGCASFATAALCQHDLWVEEEEEEYVLPPQQKKVVNDDVVDGNAGPSAIPAGGSRMNVDTMFFPGAVPVELSILIPLLHKN